MDLREKECLEEYIVLLEQALLYSDIESIKITTRHVIKLIRDELLS